MTRTKLSACFASFGAKGKNPRWSWSARSGDGTVVVITLWKDRLSFTNGDVVYDDRGIDKGAWVDGPGNRERIENLIWAREKCDGYFRAVVTIAENVSAQPRRIADCYPQPRWNMKLVELNEATGEFRAVHIP